MNDRRLLAKLNEAMEALDLAQRAYAEAAFDLHGNAVSGRLGAMRDAMNGWPRAARTDSGVSSGTVWCDEHERDLGLCHRERLDCAGAVITHPSDPVGEAATRPDHAARDRAELVAAVEQLTRTGTRLLAIARRHDPSTVTGWEREQETEDDPGCEVVGKIRTCPTHGVDACPRGCREWRHAYEPTHAESAVNGNLDRPHRLGRWAYDRVRVTGRLPTHQETVAHLRGERPRLAKESA